MSTRPRYRPWFRDRDWEENHAAYEDGVLWYFTGRYQWRGDNFFSARRTVNHILCPACFEWFYLVKHRGKALEEKTCSHGWTMGFGDPPTCLRCGAKNLKNEPAFHCLGSIEENPYGREV